MLFSIIYIFASVLFALYLQNVIDITSIGQMKKLKQSCYIGISLVIGLGITTYLKNHFRFLFSKDIMMRLRNDIVNKILGTSLEIFQTHKSFEYTSILNNDLVMLDEKYFLCIPDIVINIMMCVIASITLCVLSPVLFVVSLLLSFVPIVVPFLFGTKISQLQKQYNISLEVYNGVIKNIWNGFELIKSFHVEKHISEHYISKCRETEEWRYKSGNLQGLLSGVSTSITFMTDVIVITVAAYLVIKGRTSLGTLIATIQLLNYISTPIQKISNSLALYKSSIPICKRVENILCHLPEESSGTEKIVTVTPIKIKNLSFMYQEGISVLSNINIVFEKGKKYALVGDSGSGKSTLIRVMMQQYNDYVGDILFGSQNAMCIEKESLYRQIALVHQNVVLFDGTLKDNVSLYEECSDDMVREALVKAGMKGILQEKGLHHLISEDGFNLSGGERQRIAIARAFLRNTPVVVLDEATSNLDNVNALAIENTILSSDATIINIAHRLNEEILERYDEILVFSKGKLKENGRYQDLLQQKGELYRLMKA